MDFAFTEEQQDLAALAQRILEDKVTEARAARGRRRPRALRPGIWEALADANLLGIGLPADVGGSGYGLVEQCVVLEQVGRTRRAGAGRWPRIVLGAAPIAAFGTDEQQAALGGPGGRGHGRPDRRAGRAGQPRPAAPGRPPPRPTATAGGSTA